MKKTEKKYLGIGSILLVAFAIWTILVQTFDVKPVGQNGTDVGFATINVKFHEITGVHMAIYDITDILSVVPLLVCVAFGCIGLIQFLKRKSLFKVDQDIVLLGIYYVIVMMGYALFELIPINFRPILIEGKIEASYPSSTTLLVLSVMLTCMDQICHRINRQTMRKIICIVSGVFSLFMVVGRTISGVHWLTDIIGSVLFSFGLFFVYKAIILLLDKRGK